MSWMLQPDQVVVWSDAPVDELLNHNTLAVSPADLTTKQLYEYITQPFSDLARLYFLPYQAESLPVRLPLTQSSEPLAVFNSLAVETVACEVAKGEKAETHNFAVDSVLYAGAPVWTLDWCPLAAAEDAAAGPLNTVETLAVSTHPKGQRRNPIGLQHTGPGAVQLWAIPSSVGNPTIASGLPQVLALLWHEGRLAWDVEWCPQPSAFMTVDSNTVGSKQSDGSQSSRIPLQGLLAAVLGNGDVVIWAVPTIQYLLDLASSQTQQQPAAVGEAQQQQQQGDQQQQQQQASTAFSEALSLKLQPVMQLSASDVCGSLASCCSWLPAAPWDQMLVGHWDGNVSIWRLPTAAGHSAEPFLLLRADPTPIRCVAWQPSQRWWCTGRTTSEEAAALAKSRCTAVHDANSNGSNGSSTHYFLTASSIGNLKVWDAQDVLQPCHERILSRNSINSCLWLGPPHVWVTASADGLLRLIWLDAGVQATNTTTWTADVSGSCGNVWCMSSCAPMAVVAYVSDGGLLGLMPLEPPTGENRHRKSHAALSAVAVSEQQLWLLSAREIPGNGGLYTNVPNWKEGSKRKSEASAPTTVVVDPLPHPDQVLHAVKFSPNYRGLSMLAYGGGAGIVRIHSVSADVLPVGI